MATEAKIIVKIDDSAARRKTDKLKRDEKRSQGRAGGGGSGGSGGQGRGGGGQGRGGSGAATVAASGNRRLVKAAKGILALKAIEVFSDFLGGSVREFGDDRFFEGITDFIADELKRVSERISKVESGLRAVISLSGQVADFQRGQQLLGGTADASEIASFLKERFLITQLLRERDAARAAAGRGALGKAGEQLFEQMVNKLVGSGAHG